jgi:hypothetical protein
MKVNMLKRTLITGAMVLIAGLLMLILIYQRPTSSATSTVDAWPPFTMYYREEGQVHVISNGKPGMQSYKFVFNSTRDWTHTISDSTQKEFVGSYKKYTGETMVEFDASTNYTTTTDTSKDEYPYIPDQWLTIGYIKGLQQMSNVTKGETDDPALEKLILLVAAPCDQPEPNVTDCKPGQEVRAGSREITYRVDTLIPMLVVDKVEGEAVYTATLEKIEFR